MNLTFMLADQVGLHLFGKHVLHVAITLGLTTRGPNESCFSRVM